MAAFPPLLKRYALPLLLLSLSVFFQLIVIPSTFPPSHYDVLGVRRYAPIEEVSEAYVKLSAKWNSGSEIPNTDESIKIRYAYELLSNPLWKRDYDTFGLDENLHVIDNINGELKREKISKISLPLLTASSFDPLDHDLSSLTAEDFRKYAVTNTSKVWLIQVYSAGSARCSQFADSWKTIARLLDGVAHVGEVELGQVQLAAYLAERRPTGQPFFRHGLPSFVALPLGCQSSDCLVKYPGELSVDAVLDWAATSILGLPRILYYSKDTLGPKFLAKSGRHKVKVIFFSKTGERAAPFLRQAASDYWAYASFAFVLWREEESAIWWNSFEVESAPAVVFIKDPGVKPFVYHGTLKSSLFSNIMEQNKQQELPQLRSLNSKELGCDARGISRAGNDTMTWYCVILAGRPSLELNQMRETVRRVQDILSNDADSKANNEEDSSPTLAAETLKEKRLTFAWLDGETQKKYCFFYLHSEDSYETCGPQRYGDATESPRIFIVRYRRNLTDIGTKVAKKQRSMWDLFQEEREDTNLASQLVARYNGSTDVPEIIKWISQIIKDGDSRDLPFFTADTPELVPEDSTPIWSKGAHGVLSPGKGMKHRLHNIIIGVSDRIRDPRIGPALLLGACISFGSIWLHKPVTKPPEKAKDKPNRRRRPARASDQDRPSSITDAEPNDAVQLLSSGSDTD